MSQFLKYENEILNLDLLVMATYKKDLLLIMDFASVGFSAIQGQSTSCYRVTYHGREAEDIWSFLSKGSYPVTVSKT